MEELKKFSNNQLLELFKQYGIDDCVGTGKGGRVLKIDRIHHILPHLAPKNVIYEMDVFSFLKIHNINFCPYLTFIDLMNLSRVNHNLTKYVDNISLKMILLNKNIRTNANVGQVLYNFYNVINNIVDKNYPTIPAWINPDRFRNAILNPIIKWFVYLFLRRITKRYKQKITMVKLKSSHITINKTIELDGFYIKVNMSIPVNVKLIKYIAPILEPAIQQYIVERNSILLYNTMYILLMYKNKFL